MIHNHDRSGWFGASDTAMIMGNWSTKTFANWWLVKMGINKSHFASIQMQTGTALEHRILAHIGITKMDRQIRFPSLLLRVNLDGEDRRMVTEVKTYSVETFRVTKPYWMQAQVEMFATKKQLRIAAYQVTPDDYMNWFLPIDPDRLSFHPVEWDGEWIAGQYLPRLRYLAHCLRKGAFPNEIDFQSCPVDAGR